MQSRQAERVSANEHRWMQDQRRKLHELLYEPVRNVGRRIRDERIQFKTTPLISLPRI
jgi:hypothetical protein